MPLEIRVRVVYSADAEDELKRLPANEQTAIRAAVE
jgi:hypothetical protein